MTTFADDSRQRFEELLPFYVVGRVSPADGEWTERYLAAHPHAQAELNWHQDLRGEVASKAEARSLQAPEMVGWAGVQKALRAQRAVATPSWSERLSAWLRSFSVQRLAPVAAVLILVQGAMIGTLLNRTPADEAELTRSTSVVAARDVLQVRFRQQATEHDLRALLYGAGARIVDGPDQLGDYVVEPRRGALTDLQAELGKSPLVQSVTTLKAWKAEPRED
jgi:anti-sigma factor RsiW